MLSYLSITDRNACADCRLRSYSIRMSDSFVSYAAQLILMNCQLTIHIVSSFHSFFTITDSLIDELITSSLIEDTHKTVK